MPAWLAGALNAVKDYLQQKHASDQVSAIFSSMQGVARDSLSGISGAWWLVTRIKDEAHNDRGYVVNSASNFGASMAELRIAMRHIYDTIIPNTNKLLLWWVYWTWVRPLWDQVKQDTTLVLELEGNVSGLQNWRQDKADPLLGALLHVIGFLGEPLGSDTLPWGKGKDWIELFAYLFSDTNHAIGYFMNRYQDSNGNWHAPPLVEWLAAHAQGGPTDDLLQVLIQNSPDRYRYVITAAETILAQPYPYT